MLPSPNRSSDRSISKTANSQLGLKLKTGFRIGFAEQTASNPQSAYSTGTASEFAGSLPPFEPFPIPDISRYLLEWLENWQQALADRRLMKSGMIIDYPVLKYGLLSVAPITTSCMMRERAPLLVPFCWVISMAVAVLVWLASSPMLWIRVGT